MEIAFPVIDPWLVKKDYSFDISQEVVDRLDIRDKEKILVITMVRIPQDNPLEMTVNLLAPVIINTENRQAIQLVLDRSDYSLRHHIRDEIRKIMTADEDESC
jgi:flagellar assembly factor FliW